MLQFKTFPSPLEVDRYLYNDILWFEPNFILESFRPLSR